MCAVPIAFSSGWLNDSTSALPWGYKGVLGSYCIPSSFIYVLNSLPLKGGPLSVVTFSGIPCLAKIMSSFGFTFGAEVDFRISISG